MEFWKMHGLGNDFIVIDAREQNDKDQPKIDFANMAKQLCARKFQVGADGLVVISEGVTSPFKVNIFNADGSEAEMCGNAMRCIGKFLYEINNHKHKSINLETKAGTKALSLNVNQNIVTSIEVNMGKPSFLGKHIPVDGCENNEIINYEITLDSVPIAFTGVSMGNPHAVIFQDTISLQEVEDKGPVIETHPFFPYGTNVEFVRVIDRQNLEIEVWERGVGRTYACGTGACASLAAAAKLGLTEPRATVKLPGGNLTIAWDHQGEEMFMSGSASIVFQGTIYSG